MPTTYRGGCRCGVIRYEIAAEPMFAPVPVSRLPVRDRRRPLSCVFLANAVKLTGAPRFMRSRPTAAAGSPRLLPDLRLAGDRPVERHARHGLGPGRQPRRSELVQARVRRLHEPGSQVGPRRPGGPALSGDAAGARNPSGPGVERGQREKTMATRGSCHCGKIAFHIDAEPTEAIECNCSICRRKVGAGRLYAGPVPPGDRARRDRRLYFRQAPDPPSVLREVTRLLAVRRGHGPRRRGDGHGQPPLRRPRSVAHQDQPVRRRQPVTGEST